MGRRLVLNITKDEVSFSDIQTFYRTAAKAGVEASASVTVDVTDEEILFGVRLPDDRLLDGSKVKVKKQTKKQKAVKKQIKKHVKKRAAGKPDAYVAPAGRTSPPKPTKIKCPVCNVRKPIVKTGAISSIKPHVVHGEPCAGSGTQVVKSGRSFKVA